MRVIDSMGSTHTDYQPSRRLLMKLKTTLAAIIFTAFALPALAQTPAPATAGVDKRQAAQQQRIDQGVKSGELTNKEAARMEKGQERVQKMEDKAKADGKVTAKEREHLQKAQNTESKKIYKEKHDRQHDRNHDGKRDQKRAKN
jgi:Skp family chaperone for outer membrane proteins